jgi:GH24 family phage-related lysozyme (muramidase)
MTDLAAQLIDNEEGLSSPTVYFVAGVAHIGRGVCVDASVKGAGLTADELDFIDSNRLQSAKDLAADLPGFQRCNDVRQAVLVSMCYQLGALADWAELKAHLALADYDGAADAMLASKWSTQTPLRAQKEAALMRSGIWTLSGE